MRWKVTPPSRKPVPKPGQIRSVLRFAVWPRKTRSGWFVWLERYWSLEAWTYYRTEYSGWFAWAVFARFTTDGLSPFEVREAAEAHRLEIVDAGAAPVSEEKQP